MSRALKASLERLQKWVFSSPSRVNTIASGQGDPGTRAAPTKAGNTDKKVGVRLDNGEKFIWEGKEYKRYKLQVNKGAEDGTLKKMADKNSHEIWSQADIPLGEGSPEDVVKRLFEDLKANLKK